MSLIKRSMTIKGHATSVRLEPEFWAVLEASARHSNVSLAALISRLDSLKPPSANLASALRVYALQQAQKKT